MRIRLKLYASLGEYLPAGAADNMVELEVEEGATPSALIERYQIPRRLAHLVLRNGVFIPPGERDTTALADGDTLAIWPPVAGGAPRMQASGA